MDNEVWRPVKGWEAFYLVSNKGRVKSLDRKCKRGNGFALHEGQIMKQQDNNMGYKYVLLRDGDTKEKAYVHRLVATAFLHRPLGATVVNHLDFNPKNNRVENLEWTTPEGNFQYSADRGRYERTQTWRSHLKLALDEAIGKPVMGKSLLAGTVVFYKALNDCAKDGFQPSCVSCCCNGKRKTHAGFTWEFVPPDKLEGMMQAWDAASARERSR